MKPRKIFLADNRPGKDAVEISIRNTLDALSIEFPLEAQASGAVSIRLEEGAYWLELAIGGSKTVRIMLGRSPE